MSTRRYSALDELKSPQATIPYRGAADYDDVISS